MMTISTRGRYATRMAVLLAAQPPGASMTKSEIAGAEGISAGYVQQLMMALRLAGVIESHRGREGGFSLSRPAGDITVATLPAKTVVNNDLFSRTTIAELAEKHAAAAAC